MNLVTTESAEKLRIPINKPVTTVGPIEQEMRKTLRTLKDSKYQDQFDWGVYDRIAKRYEEKQVRGGVVFNTTFKLVNHHASCTRCHYAFELDTYGRGCVHNCVYCYAKDQLSAHGIWNQPIPFPVNLAEVRKVFYKVFETDQKSKWRDIMMSRTPIRIGSMSDSFMWSDKTYGVTKELLKILDFYSYPYIIFTRSDLVATDEYLALLRKDLCSVQLSISGGNESLTKLIEPGAPSVKRRLLAIKKLNNAGIWNTVRINPLFPIYPDGYFSNHQEVINKFGSENNIPRFDLFNFDFVSELADYSATSVLAGFVRLSNHAIKAMSRSTGVDLRSFFTDDVLAKNGDKHFSDAEISVYYRKLKDACKASGMRFSTCYIGNGLKDYCQYQNLWTNKTDCCDAVGNVKAIIASSQDVPWETRIKSATCKDSAILSQKQDEAMAKQHKESAKLKIVPRITIPEISI